MQLDDLINIFIVLLLFLLPALARRKKKQKEDKSSHKQDDMRPSHTIKKAVATLKRSSEGAPVKKEEKKTESAPKEDLVARFSDDQSYSLHKPKSISRGKKYLKDKSTVRSSMIVSEILKRPYD